MVRQLIEKLKEKVFGVLHPYVCERDLQKIAELHALIDISAEREIELREELVSARDEVAHQKTIVKELVKEKEIKVNDVDAYFDKKSPKIPNRAYTNKRTYADYSYTEFVNHYIQPNSYPVLKFKHTYKTFWRDQKEYFETVRLVSNMVNKLVHYTSDKNLNNSVDFYQTPAETLASRKGDCEDFAFLLASLFPQKMGVAYGYHGKTGHAFNVFIHNDELWVADTSTSKNRVFKFEEKPHEYTIHFVITPSHTYLVKFGAEFGQLAGWLPY